MPGGHDTTIEVSNIMSFVLYTQILKQSVLKPASPGITLTGFFLSVWPKGHPQVVSSKSDSRKNIISDMGDHDTCALCMAAFCILGASQHEAKSWRGGICSLEHKRKQIEN